MTNLVLLVASLAITVFDEAVKKAGEILLPQGQSTDVGPGETEPAQPPLLEEEEFEENFEEGATNNLLDLSLEELLSVDVQVTSVAKKSQRISESAAAVYVITEEDIRRSGHTSLPELLRMVPGLHVARINNTTWAISSRGFNGEFANKMLVLIDGRSVYTPLFSGVYWDVQDVILEDVARIEVIRGPGASLWGANAVNGVINIITKSAADTQGMLMSGTLGSHDNIGALRYGGETRSGNHFRVWAKGAFHNGLGDTDTNNVNDDYWQTRGGFRYDGDAFDDDAFSVSSEIYTGMEHRPTFSIWVDEIEPVFDLESEVAGGNLLSTWTHRVSDESEIAALFYFDATRRDSEVLTENRNTWNLELQHRFPLSDSNELIWGIGSRYTISETRSNEFIAFEDPTRRDELYSGFIQDEAELAENLRFTIGTKLEYNDYTGFELQPSARLLWELDPKQTLWSAVSRAVRTPSQADHDVTLPIQEIPPSPPEAPFPQTVYYVGNDDFDSEILIAYEVGYRIRPEENLSFDVAAFFNDYDRLLTTTIGAPVFDGTQIIIPTFADNEMEGITYGIELGSEWHVASGWILHGGYTFLHVNLDPHGEEEHPDDQKSSPKHQFHMRSYVDFTDQIALDAAVYYVDQVESQDVDAYVRSDVRLGWRPSRSTEFSLGIQNLFHDGDVEYGNTSTFGSAPKEIETAVYAKATFRF